MRATPSLVLVAISVAGCLTTPVQRVETLGAKNFEVAIEGGISGLDTIPLPAGNVAVRYGVSDRVDLGLRVGSWLYEVQGKYMFTPIGSSNPVSLAPSFTYVQGEDPFDGNSGDTFGIALLRLPVLVGIPVADKHQLVLGPGVNNIFGINDGRVGYGLEARMSVGFSAQLSPGLRLQPEVGVGIGGLTIGDGNVETSFGTVRYSAVIGLAGGNSKR